MHAHEVQAPAARIRRIAQIPIILTILQSVFNVLEFLVHHFIYVSQLGLDLVRRTYDDDDNTFIHLFTVLTIAICSEFPSWQLAENVYKANGIDQ